jgi:hypothetical protein
MSTYKIQYGGSEEMPSTISEPVQYIPNVYKDTDNNMIMYIRMTDNLNFHSYIGSGLVINTHKGFILDNHFVLGTSGLNGCVALAIKIDHLGKQMVWLSHISSDIHEKNLTIILKLILRKINVMLQNDERNAITWDIFDGINNKINLVYSRQSGQSERLATTNDGVKIELDKLIGATMNQNNIKYDEYPGSTACYFSVQKIDSATARMFNKPENKIIISFKTEWPFQIKMFE